MYIAFWSDKSQKGVTYETRY